MNRPFTEVTTVVSDYLHQELTVSGPPNSLHLLEDLSGLVFSHIFYSIVVILEITFIDEMILVDKNTIDLAVNILAKAYAKNPSVNASLKRNNPKNRKKLFRLLCAEMMIKKALYITSDFHGVAAFYPSQNPPFNLKILFIKLRLLFFVTGIRRGLETLRRNKEISKRRRNIPSIYFWLLAVDPDVKGITTIQEIRDNIFQLSKEKGLPVLAETPMLRTKALYERYGFQTYDSIVFSSDLQIWMLERPVKTHLSEIPGP